MIVTVKLFAPRSPELGLVDVTVATAMTVKMPLPVPIGPPIGLLTVTLPAPTAAVGAIAMFAISVVELENVVELTVIPVAENATVAPL